MKPVYQVFQYGGEQKFYCLLVVVADVVVVDVVSADFGLQRHETLYIVIVIGDNVPDVVLFCLVGIVVVLPYDGRVHYERCYQFVKPFLFAVQSYYIHSIGKISNKF